MCCGGRREGVPRAGQSEDLHPHPSSLAPVFSLLPQTLWAPIFPPIPNPRPPVLTCSGVPRLCGSPSERPGGLPQMSEACRDFILAHPFVFPRLFKHLICGEIRHRRQFKMAPAGKLGTCGNSKMAPKGSKVGGTQSRLPPKLIGRAVSGR